MSSGPAHLHIVTNDNISPGRKAFGRLLVWGSAALMLGLGLAQLGQALDWHDFGFQTWRPTLYAFCLWATSLCWAQILMRGEQGKRTLFVLPAALFVVALTVFPLLFGLIIAFSSWNLSSPDGRQFNGTANLVQMWGDPFYWNALWNMVWYTLAIIVEYAIAFGLALMLSTQIRARKFFRVAFLLPLMLSPVAVSWMIGKSMLEARFGPLSRLARSIGDGFEWIGDKLRWIGLDSIPDWIGSTDFGSKIMIWFNNPSFFETAAMARATIMVMDAWTFIPFMMIMLLAGLQAIPKELTEASRVDGATGWKSFWEVTFPLMLPVSVTAILIRIIFKLKLADIVINVTSGGPGGATDTVTSFIFREYRDRSNVGYGTMLAMVYLVLIVIFMTILMKLAARWTRPRA
jgi:multiple sugar transport system permease protein